jgi:isopentenyl-diphosphate Delta-isomerase
MKSTVNGNSAESISELRTAVEKEDFVLTAKSYEAAKTLFLTAASPLDRRERWKAVSPEYGSGEYFRTVDRSGRSVSTAASVLDDFRRTLADHADFEVWFIEESSIDQERPERRTLCPARWLCHLVGFRHLSVHLFLKVDGDDEHLLVQVRGTEKAESPGAFDLPVAGHVAAEQKERVALLREAKEELGLEADDLLKLTALGGYEYKEPGSGSWMRNIEFRWLFEAALSPGTFSRLRPARDEVAAIALFSLSEVESMIATFPERVASGLRSSFPVYRDTDRFKAHAL